MGDINTDSLGEGTARQRESRRMTENANSKTVPSNTGVLTNDNGNANTAGVRSTNSNNRNSNRNNNQH